jgi:hypothetical protein
LALAVVALAAVLSACNESSEPLGPTATVPQGTTTTNPYAVPAVIDAPYVNRVLAGLDAAVGDVSRMIVASKTIPPEAIDRLEAIYVDQEQLQLTVDVYQDNLLRGFPGQRPTPGNRVTTVVELLSATPDCIFAKVDVDSSAIFEQPNERLRNQWVSLVPADRTAGNSVYNPTFWGFIYEGFTRDLSAPVDPCAAF